MMHDTRHKTEKGFTLIEALVAFLMLTVAIAPSFFVMVSSMNLGGRIRMNLTAANLAQEGIEVVRAVRDANWFDPTNVPFDTNLTSRCGPPNGCLVQWNTIAGDTAWPQYIAGTDAPNLRYDPVTGLYDHTTGATESQFERRIFVTADPSNPGNNNIRLVQAVVTWAERGKNFNITVQEILTDWKKP